jgi:pimeloyl-ACP methyl ester carboxylesterase
VAGIYKDDAARDRIRAAAATALDAWGRAHETRTVTTALGPTHVLRVGQGPPVLLLPGTNFSAAVSLDLIGALARTHEVLAVDLPGQPGLSHDERPGKAAEYGIWLADLIPRLTDDSPVLVGHSLGGRIVLSGLAEGAPAIGALLVDPAGLIRLRVPLAVMLATVPWMLSPDGASARRLTAAMSAPNARPDPAMVAWMAEVGRSVRSSLAPPPLPADTLAAVDDHLVTVVVGEHDPFLPAATLRRAVARHLPAAQFVTARDAGHLLPHDRPEVVTHLVAELSG